MGTRQCCDLDDDLEDVLYKNKRGANNSILKNLPKDSYNDDLEGGAVTQGESESIIGEMKKKLHADDLEDVLYKNAKEVNNIILKNLLKGGYNDELEGGAVTQGESESIISKMKKKLHADDLEDPATIKEYLDEFEPKLSNFDKMLIRYSLLKSKNERTKFIEDIFKSGSIMDELMSLPLTTDIESRKLVKQQSNQWDPNTLRNSQILINDSSTSDSILMSISFGDRAMVLFNLLQAMFLTKITIFDNLFLLSDLIEIVTLRNKKTNLLNISPYDTHLLDNLIIRDLNLKSSVKKPLLFIINALHIIKKIVYNIRGSKSFYPNDDIKKLLNILLTELEMIEINSTESLGVNLFMKLSNLVGLYPVIAIVAKKKLKNTIESFNIVKYNNDYLNLNPKDDRKTLIEKYFKDEENIKNQRENILKNITADKDLFISLTGKTNIKSIIKAEGVIPAYVIRKTRDTEYDLCYLSTSCLDDDETPTITREIELSEQRGTLVSALCYEEQLNVNSSSISSFNENSLFPLIKIDNVWLDFSKRKFAERLMATDNEIKTLSANLTQPNNGGQDFHRLMGMYIQRGINVKDASTFIISDNDAMDIINNRSLILFYQDKEFSSDNNLGLSCIF